MDGVNYAISLVLMTIVAKISIEKRGTRGQ